MIGAALGENNPDRTTWRSGYRARAWKPRAGEVELPIPKLRHGRYFPSFLSPLRLTETALTSVIQQAFVPGRSTRKVDRLVQAMGLSGVKRSEVSLWCQELDTRVGSFLDWPLEGQWPLL